MAQSARMGKGDVALLVGTRKGAFILSGGNRRKAWTLSEPHIRGGDVYHMTYDARNGGAIYAAVNYPIWGAEIHISRDLGDTWTSAETPPKFAERNGLTLNKIWHIAPGPAAEPDVLYAGADPASLFKSDDGGLNWQEVRSLADHPSREFWAPGFGGLCLHSIALDPRNAARMWVAISSAGVFGTSDGDETWEPLNKGVRADFMPETFPEVGQCAHKLLAHPAADGLLYQQNHCGVYRSRDGGASWDDISDGLPSRFGLPLGLHPHDPNTLYALPEDNAVGEGALGGEFRIVSDAKFRVYRSRNAGDDWEPLTDGLPQRNAYLHCMREGIAADTLDPCGIYIGTTNGQIFYSRNEGESWELMIDNLPPINSIECAIV